MYDGVRYVQGILRPVPAYSVLPAALHVLRFLFNGGEAIAAAGLRADAGTRDGVDGRGRWTPIRRKRLFRRRNTLAAETGANYSADGEYPVFVSAG